MGGSVLENKVNIGGLSVNKTHVDFFQTAYKRRCVVARAVSAKKQHLYTTQTDRENPQLLTDKQKDRQKSKNNSLRTKRGQARLRRASSGTTVSQWMMMLMRVLVRVTLEMKNGKFKKEKASLRTERTKLT